MEEVSPVEKKYTEIEYKYIPSPDLYTQIQER